MSKVEKEQPQQQTALQKVEARLDKNKNRGNRNPDMLPWYLADKMTDPESVESYTEFTGAQVMYFAKRAALSDMLANDTLPDESQSKKKGLVFVDSFRHWYATLNKSLDRKSSIEIRDMVKSNTRIVTQGTLGANVMNPGLEEEQKKKHFWSGWFG